MEYNYNRHGLFGLGFDAQPCVLYHYHFTDSAPLTTAGVWWEALAVEADVVEELETEVDYY